MKKNYIPTINISSILNNNFTSNTSYKIIKKIEKASIEVGFFQIIGHKLDVKKTVSYTHLTLPTTPYV